MWRFLKRILGGEEGRCRCASGAHGHAPGQCRNAATRSDGLRSHSSLGYVRRNHDYRRDHRRLRPNTSLNDTDRLWGDNTRDGLRSLLVSRSSLGRLLCHLRQLAMIGTRWSAVMLWTVRLSRGPRSLFQRVAACRN
jgi:hypothetical protein